MTHAMLSPESIKRWAGRRYLAYLSAAVSGNGSFFPLDMRFGKVKPGEAAARFGELRLELAALRTHSEESGRPSYRVDWEHRGDRLAGNQQFPRRIYFPDASSLLGFLGKEQEAQRFFSDAEALLQAFPALRDWVARYPAKIVEAAGSWDSLVRVLRWFAAHPRPGVFIREIPAVEDTKFIERNQSILSELLELVLPADAVYREAASFTERFGLRQPEGLIRVRLLDRSVAARYLAGVSELALPPSEIDRLAFPDISVVIIVENKASFSNLDVLLSLPDLPGAMAVFGSGFSGLALGRCTWMRDRRLLYWGDIDSQGLRILAGLRQSFPNLESILMDEETFDRFPQFRSSAPADALRSPSCLTPPEEQLYARLVRLQSGNRLEQERIPGWWASERIQNILARGPT